MHVTVWRWGFVTWKIFSTTGITLGNEKISTLTARDEMSYQGVEAVNPVVHSGCRWVNSGVRNLSLETG